MVNCWFDNGVPDMLPVWSATISPGVLWLNGANRQVVGKPVTVQPPDPNLLSTPCISASLEVYPRPMSPDRHASGAAYVPPLNPLIVWLLAALSISGMKLRTT